MSVENRVWPCFAWFTDLMRKKLCLPKNLRKSHWTDCDLDFLKERLRGEMGELLEAIDSGDEEAIASEAADVAACAMMIADSCDTNRGNRK